MNSVVLYCEIPLFLEHAVPHVDSPRHFIEVRQMSLQLNFELCNCAHYARQNILRIHHCIDGLLIGQWEKASLAFVHCPFDLVLLRSALLMVTGDWSKYHKVYVGDLQVEAPIRTQDLLDLNAFLTLTDGTGHILLSNTWRSFDIIKGQCLLLSSDEWGLHIPFDHPLQVNLKVGNFEVKINNTFVVKFQAYTWDGLCVVDLVGWVLLKPAQAVPVTFGEEPGERMSFSIQERRATLAGLVLRNLSGEKIEKLIRLNLQLEDR